MATKAGSIKLPPEKIAELETHARALNDILYDIDNCEAVGVDCSEFRRIRDEYYAKTNEIIARFK